MTIFTRRWQGALAALLLLGAFLGAAVPSRPASAAGTQTWNALVLVYRNTDVTYGGGNRVRTWMTGSDVQRVGGVLGRFQSTVYNWSGGMARIRYTFVYPDTPIRSVTSLGSNGYWLSPSDIAGDIDRYAPHGRYDSIIVNWRGHDDRGRAVPTAGWGWTIPPGGWANGAGYTVVTTPRNPGRQWPGAYPEEIFVHEWTHQATDHYESRGYRMPNIDAAGSYGYSPDGYGGWRSFLSDVLRGRIRTSGGAIGIGQRAWASGTPTRRGGVAATPSGNRPPRAGYLSPATATSYVGRYNTLTATYTDANGFRHVQWASTSLFDTTGYRQPRVLLVYNQSTNRLWVRNQRNTRWVGGYRPGAHAVIRAGHVTVDVSRTSVYGSGATLSVRWSLLFRAPADDADYAVYLRVRDDASSKSPFKWAGRRYVR